MKYAIPLRSAVICCIPFVAFAQTSSDQLGEVVVTAERRSERLVDVPISVDAISATDLETKRIDQLSDLSKMVTSLRFENTQPSFQPTLRGIGTQVQGGGVDTSVAVYMDGVFLPNMSGMTFDLPNVDSVQVLKGPQGTLFGRNATGGAILITTAEPSSTPTGNVKLTYARFDDKRIQGYLSGGLSDDVSAGMSVYYRTSPGAFKNIYTGAGDDARIHMLDVRPDLLFTNHDNLSIRLTYEHSYAFDTSSAAGTNPDGYAVARLFPGAALSENYGTTGENDKPTNLNKADAGTAIVDWKITGGPALKSVTSYRKDSNEFTADGDGSSLPLFSVATETLYKTLSEELTVADRTGPLDWIAGAYYWHQKEEEPDVQIVYGIPVVLPTAVQFVPLPLTVKSASVKTDALAGFADLTYQMNERLFLTAGGRYSTELKHLDSAQIVLALANPPLVLPAKNESHRWNAFTPRAVIRYQFEPDSNAYASFSKGFKSGAYTGYPPNRVDPEHVDAYEVGFKHTSKLFDVNGAAFLYNYTDAQVSVFDFQSGLGTTVNAEKQRNYGAELETVLRPTDAWRISLSGAYLEAKFIRFSQAQTYVHAPGAANFGVWVPINQPADDTQAPRSPKWSGNLATSYDIDVGAGTLQLSTNVAASHSFYFYPNQLFRQPGYAEVDLNASFTSRDSHWRSDLYVTDLNDHHREAQIAAGPLGTLALWAATTRVFGVALSYNF
jgi:iron complex outermembrane recepter protein